MLDSPNARLFWISVLGLFVELLLIRWIGTEVRIFAYLQNTILVVCFLGLGAGAFTARREPPVTLGLASGATLVAILTLPFVRPAFQHTSEYLSALGDVNIWGTGLTESKGQLVLVLFLGLVLTTFIMVLVLNVFVPIGRVLGRLFDEHPRPLVAYSVNVVGSLVGTWLFVLLSTLGLPPSAWFACAFVLLLPLLVRERVPSRNQLLAAVPIVLLLFADRLDDAELTVWSPYQKLSVLDNVPGNRADAKVVRVNNIGYQVMLDLGPDADYSDTAWYPPEQRGLSRYDLPALLHPDPERVLIVGSGTGNDVAGALRHVKRSVTAVEIDPEILSIGTRLHPERPYDDERVVAVIDDARAFFQKTTETYDVVSFGLLDSHTTTAMTNARLDHYVYTEESFRQVKSILADDGIVVVAFAALRPHIIDRIANTLTAVWGKPPIIFDVPGNGYGWEGVLLIDGNIEAAQAQIAKDPRLAALVAKWTKATPKLDGTAVPATDDWPYLYLARPMIPPLFVMLAFMLGALLFYLRRYHGVTELDPRKWVRDDWHFFAMGGAFLLLEVQNISKASVALGNTWQVSATIISGVLAMVLISNAIVSRFPKIAMLPVFALLFASLCGLYFLDLTWFFRFDGVTRTLLVGFVTTLPMAMSGIIFGRSFANCAGKDRALGANLLGALVGALLQSVSFLVGIRFLLVLVAAFYLAALLTRPRLRVSVEEPLAAAG
jgi:spermidine synthase